MKKTVKLETWLIYNSILGMKMKFYGISKEETVWQILENYIAASKGIEFKKADFRIKKIKNKTQ